MTDNYSYIDIDEILFSQDTILANFKDGRSLFELIEEIKQLKKDETKFQEKIESFPPIRVVRVDEQYVSLDNRRLFVFKECFKWRRDKNVKVEVLFIFYFFFFRFFYFKRFNSLITRTC